MQNSTAQKPERKEIPKGKYEFLVQGVLKTDSNGYDLKTSKGNSYQKLRIILIGNNDNYSMLHNVFSKKDIQEIVFCLNNPALTHVYNSNPDNFELEYLIGEEGGRLLLGHKEYNGENYPKIECYLKAKPVTPEAFESAQVAKTGGAAFASELDEADNVPF
jgi:hypothetical protein